MIQLLEQNKITMYQMNSYSSNSLKKKDRKIIVKPFSEQRSLSTSQYVKQFSSYNLNQVCLRHSKQITHLCFLCGQKCLCNQCLQQGQHKSHDVKNVDRSHVIIETNLNQYLIRLRSKCDILSLLCQKINSGQTAIYEDLQAYKEKLETNIYIIINTLNYKKQQMIKDLNQLYQDHAARNSFILSDIRNNIQQTMNLHNHIEKAVNQLSHLSLCILYSEKKFVIQQFMSEQIINKFKEAIPEISIDLDLQAFQQINNKISNIRVFDDNNIQKILGKVSKKKLRKISKIPHLQRFKKQRTSHRFSPFNQMQSQSKDNIKQPTKRATKMFEHEYVKTQIRKPYGKITSMPVSPIKQKKQSSPIIKIDNNKKKISKKKDNK